MEAALKGDFHHLPAQDSNVVRIFLSSTFGGTIKYYLQLADGPISSRGLHSNNYRLNYSTYHCTMQEKLMLVVFNFLFMGSGSAPPQATLYSCTEDLLVYNVLISFSHLDHLFNE